MFATVKLELLAILRMDFTFELPTLHNFLWRTSLDWREVLEQLFSSSFGGIKVVMLQWEILKVRTFAEKRRLLAKMEPKGIKTAP